MELQPTDLSGKIIKAFYKVYNELGFGFSEKVYENALIMELRSMNLVCVKQKPVKVFYNGQIVGEYFADVIVNEAIVLELTATDAIVEEYEYQLINQLKASELEMGLLLNFGQTPQFKRKVFTNDRKNIQPFKFPAPLPVVKSA